MKTQIVDIASQLKVNYSKQLMKTVEILSFINCAQRRFVKGESFDFQTNRSDTWVIMTTMERCNELIWKQILITCDWKHPQVYNIQ